MSSQNIDTINFEMNNNRIQIENNPENIWQIGIPNKTIFESARSLPNVIVTDTISNYPQNNLSSFTIGFDLFGSFPTIRFWHKFDTDSLLDGGYVEISIDGGANWVHLTNEIEEDFFFDRYGIYTVNFYSESTLLHNGKSGFSGLQSDWTESIIVFPCNAVETSYDLLLRFTFISDSDDTNKEGWMIDDIVIRNDGICAGIQEDTYALTKVKVTPNPIKNRAVVSMDDSFFLQNGSFQLFNLSGQKVLSKKNLVGNNVELTRNALPSGIYLYRLSEMDQTIARGKMVFQ